MKSIKLSIVVALFTIAFASISMSLVMRDMNQTLRMKDKQIHSLIDEIGQIKDTDFQTTQNLQKIPNTQKNSTPQKESTTQLFPAAENQNLFNVLLLGNHGGLTDTIMIASVNKTKKTATLISIPRDLYVLGRKVNAVYESYGAEKLGEELEKITNLKIEKYMEINMEGFVSLVDYFGGVDVYTEKAIYDSTYPTARKGYQVFSMPAGNNHLDGETALKYSRSRHSTSDFDRAKRQHDVLAALKGKIVARDFLTHAKDAIALYGILQNYIHTNIDMFEAIGYIRQYQGFTLKTGNVLSTDNYLYSMTTEKSGYILLPKKKDFVEVKAFIQSITE